MLCIIGLRKIFNTNEVAAVADRISVCTVSEKSTFKPKTERNSDYARGL